MQFIHKIPFPLFFFVSMAFCQICLAEQSNEDYFDEAEVPLQVVLTPTRTRIAVVDSPVAVSSLDHDILFKLGIGSFEDALRLVPGMLVSYNAGHTPMISYHGTLPEVPRRMEVLIDKAPAYRPGYARVDWSRMPLKLGDVKSIEISRGPSVVDYGSKSFLSAVNILTTDPIDDMGTSINATLGTGDFRDFSLKYGMPYNDSSFSIRVNQNHNTGFDEDEYGDEYDDDLKSKSLFLKYSQTLTDNSSLYFKAMYGDSDYQWHTPADEQYLQRKTDMSQNNSTFVANYEFSGSSDGNSNTVNITGFASSFEQEQEFYNNYIYGFFFDEVKAIDRHPDLDAAEIILNYDLYGAFPTIDPTTQSSEEVQLLSNLMAKLFTTPRFVESVPGRQNQDAKEASYGLEVEDTYSFQDIVYSTSVLSYRKIYVDSETFLGGKKDDYIASISNSTRIHISPKYTLHIGAMFESAGRVDNDAFSPRFALNYKPVPWRSFRINYSVANRLPDIYETSRYWEPMVTFDPGYTDLDEKNQLLSCQFLSF